MASPVQPLQQVTHGHHSGCRLDSGVQNRTLPILTDDRPSQAPTVTPHAEGTSPRPSALQPVCMLPKALIHLLPLALLTAAYFAQPRALHPSMGGQLAGGDGPFTAQAADGLLVEAGHASLTRPLALVGVTTPPAAGWCCTQVQPYHSVASCSYSNT